MGYKKRSRKVCKCFILFVLLFCIGTGSNLYGAGHRDKPESSHRNQENSDTQAVSGKEIEPSSLLADEVRPVYIAYGIAYQNVDFFMASLKEIQTALLADGIPSFITNKAAFASIENNAQIMKDEILDYLAKNTQYDQVDIIAHSKGGLEARYMISHLDMAEYVSSLTTLATPHRGSPVADFIMADTENYEDSRKDEPAKDKKYFDRESKEVVAEDIDEPVHTPATIAAAALANVIGLLLGDENPESDIAIFQLTPAYLAEFNAITPNSGDVYYLSFASQLGDNYPNILYRTIGNAVYRTAGPNDGLVPVASAVWGDFGGLICELYGHTGLSHSDIIGGNPLTRNVEFDYIQFFKDIVQKVQKVQ